MRLEDLIEFLEKRDPNTKVKFVFGRPDSYRGYYEDLAFEPEKNTTVGKMLAYAKAALEQTYTGYKGGEYKMETYTTVWIAEYGHEGEGIGKTLLRYMVSEIA